MEINTEINKIFGQEMAKLFADSIDETELKEKAKYAWKEINKTTDNYNLWNRRDSDITTMIKNELLSRVKNEVNAILATEEVQIDIHNMAQEIINKVRERTEENIIERTSKMLADLYCADTNFKFKDYMGYGMSST